MKKTDLILFLVVLVLLASIVSACDNPAASLDNPLHPTTNPPGQPEPEKSIVISAVGDIMMHNTQITAGYNAETDAYDFSSFFSKIKPLLASSDFVIGNLETTLGTNPALYSGYPCFNAPAVLGQNLQDAGFHLLTTANNHSLDKGFAGVTGTLTCLDEIGLLHTGTARNQEERDTTLFTDIQGIKTAVLAYTYGTNGLKPPKGKEFAVNYLDEDQIINDIQKAQNEGAQLIILCLHMGEEYQAQPNSNQIELAQTFLQAGADIILGGHPHVLQPAVVYTHNGEYLLQAEPNPETSLKDQSEKEQNFVIYSLGNFISGQNKLPRKASIILNLHLKIDPATNKPTFQKAEYIPIWTRQFNKNGRPAFEVLPIEPTLSYIRLEGTHEFTTSEVKEMEEAWEHVVSCFSDTNEVMTLQTLQVNQPTPLTADTVPATPIND